MQLPHKWLVFAPGSTVLIGNDPNMAVIGKYVEATVINFAFGSDRLSYLVSWWDDRIRREDWIDWKEIQGAGDSRLLAFSCSEVADPDRPTVPFPSPSRN